jgi:hypothetical protein
MSSNNVEFKGDWSRLEWSTLSPEEGDPRCLCSYCGTQIPKNVWALRMWRGKGTPCGEARFCDACQKECFGIRRVGEVKSPES